MVHATPSYQRTGLVAAAIPNFSSAMASRQWTLVVVSEENHPVRQIRLTNATVRLTIGCALLLFAGACGLLVRAFFPTPQSAATRGLEQRNEALAGQLGMVNERIAILQESLAGLEQKDELYRLVAGLEPFDEDVRQVGIGGPGDPGIEETALWAHDRRVARQSFAATGQVSQLLRRARLLEFSWREAEDTLRDKHARLAATPSIYPTAGYMTSGFSSSRWHPILDRPRPHNGVDIVARVGTPIVAAAHGRVKSAGILGEYGLAVEIDHGYGMHTRYAHASRVLVRPGQMVARGDTIAFVGQTGLAVGPHLHYEVLVHGSPADPRGFILQSRVVPD
ncbi:MAG: peptidoglycan DD-metalloendopeptidase family protein [Longimicrobiales bacterium]